MLPRATENAVAGHIWPAGRYLPTPALNHDCHAMIGKHCTKPRGICRASLWSATTRDIKEYTWPTNWWRILCTFWNIDIDWKCSFQLSCQFNAKSGAIDQLSFGDQPVDRDRLVGPPGVG